uniref:ATP-dependent DNA helicase n=1 Tax=Amphimedon queenslandica TaxID=400682 RepID=A0A1X7TLP6_AMPQE
MFISGVGGTSKSFLIQAIKCLVDDIWHPKSEHEGKTAGYWALNKEAQKRIKMTLKNLNIIIVDEAYLHMRLEDIFGTDKWFGSKNILFVGDLLQLPPVNVKTRLGAANAVNIWKETVEYDELTINERQKGDETF